MVQRSVADLAEIVRLVRFPGWQQTRAGEGEERKALRKAPLNDQLHQDQRLFDKTFGDVRQHS